MTSDNLVIKAALLLRERVPNLKVGSFTLDKVLPVAAGIGGGSADAAAALRLLAQLNGLAFDDPRIIEVAQLTGADVPVCVASRACVMTGVGENLQPLNLPKMPSVMVDPCVPVATKDVFKALGLRNGELLVGPPTCCCRTVRGRSPMPRSRNDRSVRGSRQRPRSSALRIQPVIDEVLSALRTPKVRAGGMSGSGATCFAIFADDADAQAAAEKIRRDHPVWWVHAGTLS